MPEINPKYKGSLCVAITESRGTYSLKAGTSHEELQSALVSDFERSGKEFEVIGVYENVNREAADLLRYAAGRLELGKKIDIERILQ